MRIRAIAAAAAVLLMLPLAACSPSQNSATSQLPKKDIAKWVMPLDEYWSAGTDSLSSYASNLLVSECLKTEYIDWQIPWQSTDPSSYLAPTANMSGFQHLTVEAAREYGYRAPVAPGGMGAPTAEELKQRKQFLTLAASTPGFDAIINVCIKDARKQFDEAESTQIVNTMNGWVRDSWEKAEQNAAVKQTGTIWQKCLNDAGYAVDLAAPIDDGADGTMPSRTLLQTLGIPPRWQSGDGAPENPLTQGEIELAVADATCRESSGWSKAIYDAMWVAQTKTVTEHADELVRLRERGDALLKSALQIIAEHAPEK
ncbi:hypothetical protein [Microbacterium sp.]|uniref:hypothetical protein n=1 Tax=Microbacterium sp. TaxID=51671 RepID=UPI003A93930A